jgi:Holliday junction resolvase RusA-like endonuclease
MLNPAPKPVVEFTVYGEPVAQGRPKMAVIGGHARVYDPKKSRDYKTLIRQVAQGRVPAELLTGSLVLEVKVFRPIPQSLSKRKREAALVGELRPTTRPDLRNYVGGVEDALTKLVWVDDSQIVGYGDTGKWYGDPPRVEIEVWREEDWARASA